MATARRRTRSCADPAAVPEALLAGRVLDDSVERDVLADDDLSHFGSPLVGVVSYRRGQLGEAPADDHDSSSDLAALVARTGSGSACAAFRGRPRSRSASARQIPASTAQATKAEW